MFSFFLTVLSATVALSRAQGTAPSTSCEPAVIGLSSALGVTLTGIAAAAIYGFKDRLCCTRGDRQRVYDTPCPYCKEKQPRDCVREHLADCEEHKKFWVPRLQSTRFPQKPRKHQSSSLAPPKPVSVVIPAPQSVPPS